MVERIIKTSKHGLIVLFVTPEHIRNWDKHLPKILFRYQCGIQTSTKFFPHMLLIGKTFNLKANNFLNPLVQTFDEDAKLSILVVEMIDKL